MALQWAVLQKNLQQRFATRLSREAGLMKFIVSDSIITMVSTEEIGVGLVRLRDAGDGAFANGSSLPGSGDR
jgi:hypothetical protein